MRVEVEVSDRDAALIRQFMDDNQTTEGNTHGPMNMTVLVEMLLHDVAMAMHRPLSWEGDHISDVLTAHGYKVLDW